jgi:hypothetical protein
MQSEGESTAMQLAERAKNAIIQGKSRIFERNMIDPLIINLLSQEICNIDLILLQPELPTIIKVKLYELLSNLIQIDDEEVM